MSIKKINTAYNVNLEELIAVTVAGFNYELWGIVYLSQGKHTLLRVYIDSQAGITVENCQQVSRQISAVLAVENSMAAQYTLEISSPGLDRILFNLKHFERFVGQKASIRLRTPINNSLKYLGVIQAVVDDVVLIKAEQGEIELTFADIKRANLVPDFSMGISKEIFNHE